MREYSLCALDENENISDIELLKKRQERPYFGIFASTIKDFDRKTACFPSFEVLNEELSDAYEDINKKRNEMTGEKYQRIKFSSPRIIVDVSDKDHSKSFFIWDIVYEDDKKYLDNPDDIKLWTIEYLQKNPNDISEFIGISNIWKNKYSDTSLNAEMIRMMVNSYFMNWDYKKIRDTYFTLKRLDKTRMNKNEIHK